MSGAFAQAELLALVMAQGVLVKRVSLQAHSFCGW